MTSADFVKKHLRTLGIRPTRQRVELYRMLTDAGPVHLRIHDARTRLRQKGCHVSLATLYNNFKAFAKAGIVRSVAYDVYGRIFDTNTRPHHHIINGATGEIIDTDQIDYLLKDNFTVEPGHEIASVEITVTLQPIAVAKMKSASPKLRSAIRR